MMQSSIQNPRTNKKLKDQVMELQRNLLKRNVKFKKMKSNKMLSKA